MSIEGNNIDLQEYERAVERKKERREGRQKQVREQAQNVQFPRSGHRDGLEYIEIHYVYYKEPVGHISEVPTTKAC